MPKTWGPTSFGKLFTTAMDWSVTLTGPVFVLRVSGRELQENVVELEGLKATPGIHWSTLTVPLRNGKALTLDGIPNGKARELLAAVETARNVLLRQKRTAQLKRQFEKSVPALLRWAHDVQNACRTQLKTKGWLTHEFKQEQKRLKPPSLEKLLTAPDIAERLSAQPKPVQTAASHWRRGIDAIADSINERHLAKVLQDSRDFFDKVEKSPLTDEQAKAVACFDNRVLVVAAAGSGKTSTMVAKVGYALKMGYFAADSILLLAFNKDAADELAKRVEARLKPLGLPADKVVAKTFHALGLDLIGEATGKRPSLAPWLDKGQDLTALLEIVDELKDRNPEFRTNWDLFRIVFGQDLPKFGEEHRFPDSWDKTTKQGGFWTLNNEVVKSRGEQLIANWLFYNGVEYVYEAPYKYDTADAGHRQYRPDFYFPAIDVYLEHWALDEHGNPPPEFTGYAESMAWKKKLHSDNRTSLLETTMADLWSGRALKYLGKELTKRGVVLDPNPNRPAPGRQPIENPRLARTFRSFLTHAKSNRLSVAQLRQRLKAGVAGQFEFRHRMFLTLFEDIWNSWEARLRAADCIDFEDMLNLASDCIEQGKWNNRYELIMVDEFQDASQARARLVAGLVNSPGKCLFAVGDDWQSINRFAGADLAVMTNFEREFGPTVTLRLERTFRCPQALCNVSSEFVQKNPDQLKKAVRATRSDVTDPIRIIRVDSENKIRSAVSRRVAELAQQAPAGRNKVRVFVLGRYNNDRAFLPTAYDAARVELDFITVHSAKGLEADYVILPKVTSDVLGFPSRVADDPVLRLALPAGDSFEFSEERRLFYVALTRAKRSVTLVTVAGKESTFIVELVRDHRLQMHDIDGAESATETCPECREGFLVKKKGRYGYFYGCSHFPSCRFTRRIDDRYRMKA